VTIAVVASAHRSRRRSTRRWAGGRGTRFMKTLIQLKNLRLHLQAGREATAPRTLRHWWGWLRATG
jgi:hypothetical protein